MDRVFAILTSVGLRCIFGICLTGMICPLFAQKKSALLMRDTLTGKDTLLIGKKFIPASPEKRQYLLEVELTPSKKVAFTPKEISFFREDGTDYRSFTLRWEGKEQPVFLPRVFFQPEDRLAIYRFIDPQKQKHYYYRFGEGELLPLAVTDSTSNVQSALTDYLLKFPVAQSDKRLQRYIRRMKPTPTSYKRRHRICSSGNLNYLPRFRWGVLAGIGFPSVELTWDDDLGQILSSDIGRQTQWYAGAFANVPLGQRGFSVHTEVTFSKVSAMIWGAPGLGTDMAYNRTMLYIPFSFRYTLVPIHGNFIPYIQAGPVLNIALAGDIKLHNDITDENGYVIHSPSEKEELKGFIPAFSTAIGVEWKVQHSHSLFLDIRYLKDLKDDTRYFRTSGWYLTLSYNL